MFPGTILLPLGLLLTGWSAQHRIHWIATDIVSVRLQGKFDRVSLTTTRYL